MAGASAVTPIRYDLALAATVNSVVSATQFISSTLAQYPNGNFVGYSVWVLAKADGTVTAPKGEAPKAISAFVGATAAYPQVPGTVTHTAFTTRLSPGDTVLILHPSIANTVNIRNDLAVAAVVTSVISSTQFVSSGLNQYHPDGNFVGYYVWVLAKADGTVTPPKGEAPKGISGFSSSTVTHAAFTTNLAVGDTVLLLHPGIANNVISAPNRSVLYSGSVTANWQTAETDLVSIGAAGTNGYLHSLNIYIGDLVGNINIKMYTQINGVERQIFPIPADDTFTVVGANPDPPGIPVINSTMGLYDVLRVTIQSDNAADNGQVVDYSYLLEA